MRARVLAVVVLALGGGALTPSPSSAQWNIGMDLSTMRYGGAARDTGGTHARPGDGIVLGLRVERRIRQLRAGFRLSYGKPGFSISGQGVTLTDKTSGELIEPSVVVGFQVGGIGPSGAIRADLGPVLHLWKVGDEIRSRVGGLIATSYEWAIASHITGAVRLEGALSKSWFDATDLPPEYRRQVTWRYAWGVGVSYRL